MLNLLKNFFRLLNFSRQWVSCSLYTPKGGVEKVYVIEWRHPRLGKVFKACPSLLLRTSPPSPLELLRIEKMYYGFDIQIAVYTRDQLP